MTDIKFVKKKVCTCIYIFSKLSQEQDRHIMDKLQIKSPNKHFSISIDGLVKNLQNMLLYHRYDDYM